MIIVEKLGKLSICSCKLYSQTSFITDIKGTEPSAHIGCLYYCIEILLLVIPILHNSNYFCYYCYIC